MGSGYHPADLFNFSYDVNSYSWLGRSLFIPRLRRNHVLHNGKALMMRFNFKNSYPACYYPLGTPLRDDDQGFPW